MIECINIGAKDTGQAGDVSETADAQNSLPLVSAYAPVMSEVLHFVCGQIFELHLLLKKCVSGVVILWKVCVFGLVCM